MAMPDSRRGCPGASGHGGGAGAGPGNEPARSPGVAWRAFYGGPPACQEGAGSPFGDRWGEQGVGPNGAAVGAGKALLESGGRGWCPGPGVAFIRMYRFSDRGEGGDLGAALPKTQGWHSRQQQAVVAVLDQVRHDFLGCRPLAALPREPADPASRVGYGLVDRGSRADNLAVLVQHLEAHLSVLLLLAA